MTAGPGAGAPSAGGPSAGGPSAGAPSAGGPSAGAPSAGGPSAGGPSAGGLALVLSGGGAPAAYFGAGVSLALEEAGRRPNIYSGVSAGAINAYALGSGMGAKGLAQMWMQVRGDDIYRPRLDLWNAVNLRRLLRPTTDLLQYALDAIGWTWFLDTAPARRTLTAHLGGHQLQPVDATVIVSAVDENTGNVVRFCTELPPEHRGDPAFRRVEMTIDHLLASTAVPLLFPPGRDGGGHSLVDAGLVGNTPLAPVMRYEPERVVVVSGAGISRPAPAPTSYGQAVALLVDNVAHFALTADFDHAQTVNTLVGAAPAATEKRRVPLLLIEPTDLGFSLDGFLRFDPKQARSIIEYGREQAGKALANWDD